MSRLGAYPEYVNTDVEWIRSLPSHWAHKRLKHVAPESGEKLSEKPEDTPYLALEHIESGTGKLLPHEPTEQVDSTVIAFRTGDVLFGKLRPYLAKVVHATFDGVGTTELLALRPTDSIDSRYLFYQLLSDGFIRTIDSLTYGARMPRANPDQVGDQRIAVPPYPEQRAIADFLDLETARIDALVTRFERLIALLEERRAALISHAVTKGLDPDVPMKDSGIPSIGQIPAHWRIHRNKHIWRESDRRSTTGEEELLSVSHITGVTPRSEKDVTMFMAESLEGYRICHSGDLVVNTMWAWMGALGISNYTGIVSPSYHVYQLKPTTKQDYLPEYLDMLYRTAEYVCEITRFSKGVWSSRLRLYPDAFLNLMTITPPINVQRDIVSQLKGYKVYVAGLKTKAAGAMGRLQEYRTALISAAVTGEIDVREAIR